MAKQVIKSKVSQEEIWKGVRPYGKRLKTTLKNGDIEIAIDYCEHGIKILVDQCAKCWELHLSLEKQEEELEIMRARPETEEEMRDKE